MTDKTPRAWDGALEQEFYTPEEIAASDARVGEAQLEIDREWIIEGLEFTLQESGWDANVAYDQEMMIQVVTKAIALLKAQEPITPHMIDWGIYECRKCKTRVDKTYKFCKCCGRAVKWE